MGLLDTYSILSSLIRDTPSLDKLKYDPFMHCNLTKVLINSSDNDKKKTLNFAGVCSKVDGEDCHQIDHCQLVSGPNNECTCQDPCQNSNNQDTMVRFHNLCPVK